MWQMMSSWGHVSFGCIGEKVEWGEGRGGELTRRLIGVWHDEADVEVDVGPSCDFGSGCDVLVLRWVVALVVGVADLDLGDEAVGGGSGGEGAGEEGEGNGRHSCC